MNASHWKFFALTLLSIIALLVYSCEQIVVVNLKEGLPETVIEGAITNGSGPFSFKITKTQSYFNQSAFCGIDSAQVEISDALYKDKLLSRGSGIYSTQKIRGISGRTYNLSIRSEGKSYSASVTLPPPVKIDTVYFEKGFLNKDSLLAFVQFNDPAGIENYYRVRIIRNGFYSTNDYNLITDTYTDGQTMLAPVYNTNFVPGDTVIIELLNLEKCTWKYYKGINDIIQQGVSLQAPGNPPSNISGGALGNFGAWGKSTFKIIVK